MSSIDLTAHLRPGDTIIWGQACGEPLTLTRALAAQAPSIGSLRCFLGLGSDGGTRLTGVPDLRFAAYGGGGTTRELDAAGRLDVLTTRYSDLPGAFAARTFPVDAAFVQVTPGPAPDTYHFAAAAEYLVAAVRASRVVIAEVNHGAPHTPDAPVLRADEITALVHADHPPATVAAPAPTAVDEAVAAHVAAIVEDGATVQIGIGSLPESAVRGLVGHRDLGVHSGAIGDAVADLVESGAVTNARKKRDAGTCAGGVLVGTERVLRFAHDNPAIALRDTSYTHDPAVLAGLPGFTSINAAVEVDLTGQVNTEVARGRYVGAAGGALDFARGAALSAGGAPITLLRSTVGGRSTIVAELDGPVAIPRSEAGWIVTEWGAADLRGLTLSQRRERLVQLAHPDHREDLLRASHGPGERRP
ncbi:acetyl-CoA hydrolase/transferase family protein [uncultured Jatrophihabitans sp.]|uniref:acetyl-CoA hydrolase/transferase family protein n=1 Tax=uncultured Jatrophihabitans sp. TaxID=1610747 RepID=UPI0035C9EE2F